MIQNKYFFSTQVPKSQLQLLPVIFMPLALADNKTIQMMKNREVDVLFEELSVANPRRSINGFPFFASMRMMTMADYNDAVELYNKMKSAMDAAIGIGTKT